MPWPHSLRALGHRNFRLFFVGQSVSLIGTWMQQVAMAWVVFELTRASVTGREDEAPLWLSIVSFASQIPALFLASPAGVLVDHWNRRRVILVTQTLAMLQAFFLTALMYSGVINVAWITALSVVLGTINAFDMPARQAFLSEMITARGDLANAIALNSSMFNAARLIGPALAAGLLAVVGAETCFLLNALTYLAVLASLVAMKVPSRPHVKKSSAELFAGFREGFVYVSRFAPMRAILLLVAVVSLAGSAYSILLPLIASRSLHGEEGTFGLLTIASGFGALCGAVFLASRKTVVGLGRWIAAAPALMGCGLFVLASSVELWQAMIALSVIGFGMMTQMGAGNIVMQTLVDEDKRGRVMSFYVLAFVGLSPLGSLGAGYLAGQFSVAIALRVGGIICLIAAAAFTLQLPRLRRIVRPIYIQHGLLPEMPSAVHPNVSPPNPEVRQTGG